MKTYPLNEARGEFSKLFDKALSGEPQRVTRYGKESIVIISEDTWQSCSRSAPTLGALLASHAKSSKTETEISRKDVTDRPWKNRPLGSDFG
jgi:prevent-host-death family protein